MSLGAPVESRVDAHTVCEIDDQGTALLQPPPTEQDRLTQQISQLWQAHANFDGLSSGDEDEDDSDESDKSDKPGEEGAKDPASDKSPSAELDAYAVRARVHDSLTLAQSEIQVSLDVVRLLLAARKSQAIRPSAADEEPVQIGGVPFAVGVLDAVRTEQPRAPADTSFVLGAKHRQLHEAADTLEAGAQRLGAMVKREGRFWRTAFGLRRRQWVVQQQRQVAPAMAPGDRYYVRYGFADSGSTFAEPGLAEILRTEDDGDEGEAEAERTGLDGLYFASTEDRRRLHVRLVSGAGGVPGFVRGADAAGDVAAATAADPIERAHRRLLEARSALFDRELYHRLAKEARVLELGTIRRSGSGDSADPAGAAGDLLAVALSRDNVSVHFEWAMAKPTAAGAAPEEPRDFGAWQRRFYASLAMTMASLYLRRQHREVKAHMLGGGLASSRMLAARVQMPEALLGSNSSNSNSSSAGGVGDQQADGSPVARADLLLLSPVLQALQFAKWQHVLSASTQRAVAAWRRLVDEPIEVLTHFGRTYRTPGARQRAAGEMSEAEMAEWQRFYRGHRSRTPARRDDSGGSDGMAYLVRMRFPGGTVMAIRLDSHGSLFFAKGYFPPPAPHAASGVRSALSSPSSASSPSSLSSPEDGQASGAGIGSWPEQKFIHRVFRIVPLGGLGEFTDQLRRELQSLVLLRVAAALSRCSYQRVGKQCQMGQWYVHQSQMCVVGEWWEGARHRQIIGVAKWSAEQTVGEKGGLADTDEAWHLALYFGPKHPTAFDQPGGATGVRVPWITCYPPPPSSPTSLQESNAAPSGKSFEERLFSLLVDTF
ncbi:hypothetical protein LPJ53_001828 [Coemansia erecta]|uniref:Mediator of RNA polymerase II transcription subunit 17 n=1 Tax=Coemansia erecta TaxID=147472 RepID=A0A9W7XZB6_9FUNG|nr:hypothetical protein LPJ53_001828 [Coemansia erecta]